MFSYLPGDQRRAAEAAAGRGAAWLAPRMPPAMTLAPAGRTLAARYGFALSDAGAEAVE